MIAVIALGVLIGLLLLGFVVWLTGSWMATVAGVILIAALGVRYAAKTGTAPSIHPLVRLFSGWLIVLMTPLILFTTVGNWWEKSVKEAEAVQAKVDAEEKALRDRALEPVVLACGGEGYVRWNDHQKAVGVAVFIVPAVEGKECVTGEVILPPEIRAARRRSSDRISVRRSYSNGTKDADFVEYEPTRIVRLGKTPRGWTFKNAGTEPVEQKFEAMR